MAIFVLLLSVLLCFALLALFAFGAEDAVEVLKAPAHAFRERTWFGESGKRTARFGALFKRLVSDTRGAILPAVGRFSELVTVDNGITSLGTKRVWFVDLPAELHGRAVHLEGVEIEVAITYNAAASAVPAAVTGDVVLSAIKNVKLRVGEHLYIDDLDRCRPDVRVGEALDDVVDERVLPRGVMYAAGVDQAPVADGLGERAPRGRDDVAAGGLRFHRPDARRLAERRVGL